MNVMPLDFLGPMAGKKLLLFSDGKDFRKAAIVTIFVENSKLKFVSVYTHPAF